MMIRMLMMWSLSEVERCSGINCFIGSEIMSENGHQEILSKKGQNNKRKRNNWDRRNAELVLSDISKNREEGDLVPDLVTEVRAD